MSRAVIIHSDEDAIKTLSSILDKRGVQVLAASTPAEFLKRLEKNPDFAPALAIIDLTLEDDGWLQVYQRVTRLFPRIKILITTERSDPNLIMRAKVHGAKNFLRSPYTEEGLVHALRRMSRELETDNRIRNSLPKISVPVRAKITLPFAILALFIILGAAYLAAYKAGIIASCDEISALWRCEARFDPLMGNDQRAHLLNGWKTAVDRIATHE